MEATTRRILTCLLALFVVGSCRDGRHASDPSVTEETQKATPKRSAPHEALEAANDHLEAARILAIGVPKFEAPIRGIALPTYTELPGLSYADMLSRIHGVGASHVSIVTSWDMQTIYHNKIARDPDTAASDKQVGQLLDNARGLGLGTMVFPIIHVKRRDEGEWRGRLAPTDLDRWKQSYREFILHHAKLAARHQADVLCVGSELSSMESDTDFWLALIKDVRAIFSGKLIYSANWDHYTHPKFWSELDYLGVSSYFEVAKRRDEPVFAVTERWRDHRDELLEYAAEVDKPLVLTEVGYPSTDVAAVKPWDYTAKTPANQNAQLAAFQSLATAWGEPALGGDFGGLFVWHGWGHGGREDRSYPIWGKTSEQLIKNWFAR